MSCLIANNILFYIVSTDLDGKSAWKECLSVKGVLLPTGYYFGVSATTGDLSDNHDLLSVKMYELDYLEDVCIDSFIHILIYVDEI